MIYKDIDSIRRADIKISLLTTIMVVINPVGGTRMKNCLRLFAILLAISPAAFAQGPPVGYIGLFSDSGHTSWCATGTLPYYAVTMYIFCLPSENGQMCAEFAVDYSTDPGIIKTSPTANSHISVALGALDSGMSVCFAECQTDWHWPFSQNLFINTAEKVEIRIVGHPNVGDDPTYQFANCLEDYPLEPCIIYTSLFINSTDGVDPECMTMGTGPANWGAIKSLYNE